MAQKEEAKDGGADPEFINYLLENAVHQTYFFVGKEKTKIGAVKLMLAAHSDVLRSELLDSPLAEKGNIYLEDISPSTFKNLLRYVYGYIKISNLSFDEADDLLYAAEKYLLKNLKSQLALRLINLLDHKNICSLLNNPACDTVLELDAKIKEILQYETDAVFESPDFINLRVEGFIKILEQEVLVVSEMEIWKAALKWAKNKAVSEDGSILRRIISQLKHIRIRTFNLEEICKEVVPTQVLSYYEIIAICASFGKDETVPMIKGFSDKTDKRQSIKNSAHNLSTTDLKQSSFTLKQPVPIIERFSVKTKKNKSIKNGPHDLSTRDLKQSSFTIPTAKDVILLSLIIFASFLVCWQVVV